MYKKKLLLSMVCMSVLSVSAFANIESKLGACVGCHGSNFEKSALNKSLIVKDMTTEEINTALEGYQDGTYGQGMKALMKAQLTKFSKDELKEVAFYIESLNSPQVEEVVIETLKTPEESVIESPEEVLEQTFEEVTDETLETNDMNKIEESPVKF